MTEENQNEIVPTNEQHTDDVNLFDATTANSVTKTMRAYKSMQEVFAPPVDQNKAAIDSALSTVVTNFLTQKLGGIDATPSKPGIINDFLNSATGHGLGEAFGAGLTNIIGNIINMGIKPPQTQALNNQNQPQQPQQTQPKNQGDDILSLDTNKAEDVMRYAGAMGMSESIAKDVLIAHQKDILLQRQTQQIQQSQSQPSQPTQSAQPSQPTRPQSDTEQAMMIMIEEMKSMKEHIQKLESERIEKVNASVKEITDNKWSDDDDTPTFAGSPIKQQEAHLFKSTIKVDVDDIKGNTDSFFEQPVEKKVSVTTQPIKLAHQQDTLTQSKDGKISIVNKEMKEESKKEEETDDNKESDEDTIPEIEPEIKKEEVEKPPETKEETKSIEEPKEETEKVEEHKKRIIKKKA